MLSLFQLFCPGTQEIKLPNTFYNIMPLLKQTTSKYNIIQKSRLQIQTYYHPKPTFPRCLSLMFSATLHTILLILSAPQNGLSHYKGGK